MMTSAVGLGNSVVGLGNSAVVNYSSVKICVPHSNAMKSQMSATPELKKRATAVIDTNSHDGVAKWLKKKTINSSRCR